jgi:hypothetical protein
LGYYTQGRNSGKFRIPEILCPLGSLLSDEGAQTPVEKYFLTIAITHVVENDPLEYLHQ